jgi:hypothetical protein
MSTPEEVESQSDAERGQPIDTSSKATTTVDAPVDIATAIDQLRTLVCGLGAGLLVVSLAFTAFVYKQNRNLVAGTVAHQRQFEQMQANERSVNYLVTTLVQYSSGKPELMAMLARHGLQVAQPPSSTQPPSSAQPRP